MLSSSFPALISQKLINSTFDNIIQTLSFCLLPSPNEEISYLAEILFEKKVP